MSMSKRDKLFDSKEKPKINNFRIISKPSLPKEKLEPLGQGGSGIVYLAEQIFVEGRDFKVQRAIKFFIYRDDIAEKQQASISTDNFLGEITSITKFNHENILKVIDGGIYKKGKREIPYLVTDYIEGRTLEEIISTEAPKLFFEYVKSEEDAFALMMQLTYGLKYLHKFDFYHCDIAPKNVFLRKYDGYTQLVIGDLGAGITIGNLSQKTDKVRVVGTYDYMPESVQSLKGQEIPINQFKKLQPIWDIFSAARTLKEFIEKSINTFKESNVDIPSLQALDSWLDKKTYNCVEKIYRDIDRHRPIHRKTAGVLELSEADSGTRKQLVPVSPVVLTKRMRKITKHKVFTRLNSVPQLLMGAAIFPGANHTRLEHSLGAYENMRQILIEMLKKEKFLGLLDTKTIEMALLGALLFSLTRFPFSFAVHELKDSAKKEKIYSEITQKRLLHQMLHYSDNLCDSLMNTIEANFNGVSYNDLETIICGRDTGYPSKNHQLVYSMLHSTMDVRVLDFLVRDAHHLGLKNNFDLHDLIQHIDEYQNRIAIRVAGVNAIEQVISQRYWMHKAIYWNQPNRLYMVMLKHVFFALYSKDFEKKLLKNLMFSSTVSILQLCLDEAENRKYRQVKNVISQQIMNDSANYERIYLINASEADATLAKACRKIAAMSFGEVNKLRQEVQEIVLQSLGCKSTADDLYLLIDIPYIGDKKLGDDMSVRKYSGDYTKLSEISGIVSGINSDFEDQIQWLRIFLHKKYEEKSKNDNKKIKEVIDDYFIGRF